MQPIAVSVVQNVRVERDYRKDDRCTPADLVGMVVLAWEVPDLGSIVVGMPVASILHLPRRTLPPSLGNDIAVEVVVESV